jgi:hypothetical protein
MHWYTPAFVLKNNSPGVHVAGTAVPRRNGFVTLAPLKSTLPVGDTPCRITAVLCAAALTVAASAIATHPASRFIPRS